MLSPSRYGAVQVVASAALLGALLTAGAAQAASGDFDTTFNGSGRVTTDFGTRDDTGATVRVQPDGKVLVAGGSLSGTSDFALARYNADGTPDSSFSGDGKTLIDFGASDVATDATLAPDGTIFVAGYTTFGGNGTANNFAIAKLTPGGDPDNSFDTDGRQTVDFGNDDRAQSIVLQPDGKIVVAGSWDGGAADFAFARLTPTGALDDSFADGSFHGNGRGNATFGSGTFGQEEFATDVALAPDGSIFVVGYTDNDVNGGNNNFAVLKLTPSGTPDTSFDTDGKQQINFGNDDKAEAVVIQPDGNIVVAGTWDGGAADFAIARLTPAGALDSSFAPAGVDGDGKASATFGSGTFGGVERAYDVGLTVHGRIVVAGETDAGPAATDPAVLLLRPDGTPDPDFSQDGEQILDMGGAAEARALAVSLDRVFVAGFAGTAPNRDFSTAKIAINVPRLSVDDVGVSEAAGSAGLRVLLDSASPFAISVKVTTADGSATAPGDYTALTQTVTFDPGQVEKTVNIAVANDTADEPAEAFSAALSDASGAAVADSAAMVTISDDDVPQLSLADVSASEAAGTASARVRLDAASPFAISVKLTTADGSATAPGDYTALTQTVTFDPGQVEKTVNIAVANDTADEPVETFTVTLSEPVGAAISDGSATVAIADDDVAPDRTGPVISALTLKPTAFFAAARGPSLVPSGPGGKVSFALSEGATLTLVVQRHRPGRRKKGRCVSPGRAPKGRRCARWTKRGTLTHSAPAGAGSVVFTGRLRNKRLSPGRYRLVITAKDAAGNVSKPKRVGFRIKRRSA